MGEDELTQSELLKRLGERIEILSRMQTDAMRVLSERIAAFGGLQESIIKEFGRASTLTERLAVRLAARLQARLAKS
jgi:hypothetical protein